jgi:hypothetical protein
MVRDALVVADDAVVVAEGVSAGSLADDGDDEPSVFGIALRSMCESDGVFECDCVWEGL